MTAPLVLLHAIGLDRGQWPGLASPQPGGPAVDQPGVLALDLPGHGGQPAGPAITLGGVADTVAASIPPGSDVVGLSLGGMVAQHLALRHPGQVRSLVLVCTRPYASPAEMNQRAAATEQAGMPGVLDETLRRWFTADALAGPDHPGVRYAARRLLADDAAVIAAYWRAMAHHDLRRDLRRITQPVTIVVGRQDVTSSAESAAEFHRLIPGSQLVTCEGPHLISLERPAGLARAIHDHLGWAAERERAGGGAGT